MPRTVRAALIQHSCADLMPADVGSLDVRAIRAQCVERHESLVRRAAQQGAQVCCLQELFYGPYFGAEQHDRWHALTEPIGDAPDGAEAGPTTRRMMALAREVKMAIVAPIYERAMPGLFYNTAAVIDQQGVLRGRYRKSHIPHLYPGFWEKYYFAPGDLGYPVFDLGFARVGVYICYDRHFPEGWRALGLNGAEIVFNPSATVAGLSEYLWKLEQPAAAVANQYFVGAINRVGTEKPWSIGEFYGTSYFCDPRGRTVAQAPRDKTEVLVADLDLSQIDEVRATWQFYRDRRPETYPRA
ncbi:MAG TPA: nitrilase-related carbon-nitrogen hydrolase [Phycisphaerales bacterium]|nr:nitrilase-related carbon-nitrogen hydrolase [Phycisphaerales bacterium]